MNDTKLKFIDLFCGIGGFHQVLANELGHECVLACDIDKSCREVYKSNYGLEPVPDVKKIKEKEMVDFDIICGGFPCQPFSKNGYWITHENRKMTKDPRNCIGDFFHYVKRGSDDRIIIRKNICNWSFFETFI